LVILSIDNTSDNRTDTTENADEIDSSLQPESETSEIEDFLREIKENDVRSDSSGENSENDISLDDIPIKEPAEDAIQEDGIADDVDNSQTETEEISPQEEAILIKTESDTAVPEIVEDDVHQDGSETLAVDEDDIIGELADLILPDAEPVR
jgi:flagellar protein FlaI